MDSSKEYEEQLAAACIAGKPGALDELLERYSKAIEAGAIKAIRSQTSTYNSADFEDLCQDFRMALVRRPKKFLGPFKAALGRLDDWLFIVMPRPKQPLRRVVGVPLSERGRGDCRREEGRDSQ